MKALAIAACLVGTAHADAWYSRCGRPPPPGLDIAFLISYGLDFER